MLSAVYFMGMVSSEKEILARFVGRESEAWISPNEMKAMFNAPDSAPVLRQVVIAEAKSHSNVGMRKHCDVDSARLSRPLDDRH